MKALILAFLVVFTTSIWAAGKSCKVGVTGMTCQSCVDAVAKELQAVPGVAKAEVSLKGQEATIEMKDGQAIPKDKILAAIKKAGFKAGDITETP